MICKKRTTQSSLFTYYSAFFLSLNATAALINPIITVDCDDVPVLGNVLVSLAITLFSFESNNTGTFTFSFSLDLKVTVFSLSGRFSLCVFSLAVVPI